MEQRARVGVVRLAGRDARAQPRATLLVGRGAARGGGGRRRGGGGRSQRRVPHQHHLLLADEVADAAAQRLAVLLDHDGSHASLALQHALLVAVARPPAPLPVQGRRLRGGRRRGPESGRELGEDVPQRHAREGQRGPVDLVLGVHVVEAVVQADEAGVGRGRGRGRVLRHAVVLGRVAQVRELEAPLHVLHAEARRLVRRDGEGPVRAGAAAAQDARPERLLAAAGERLALRPHLEAPGQRARLVAAVRGREVRALLLEPHGGGDGLARGVAHGGVHVEQRVALLRGEGGRPAHAAAKAAAEATTETAHRRLVEALRPPQPLPQALQAVLARRRPRFLDGLLLGAAQPGPRWCRRPGVLRGLDAVLVVVVLLLLDLGIVVAHQGHVVVLVVGALHGVAVAVAPVVALVVHRGQRRQRLVDGLLLFLLVAVVRLLVGRLPLGAGSDAAPLRGDAVPEVDLALLLLQDPLELPVLHQQLAHDLLYGLGRLLGRRHRRAQ
ncbi:hypothetical protein FOCC_FOCC000545 [Frankliniella occidentalis]|nr:hypothetical protein FOCC_FOCC000545 [Frankliniella occidentalis]